MNIVSSEFNFLKPHMSEKLIRVGRKNDGGYILPENLINETDGLLSFGYGYDSSFEEEYINLSNNSVIIFDHTCDYKKLIKSLLKNLKRFLLFRKKFDDVKNSFDNLLKYRKFINSKKVIFFRKKVVKEKKKEIDVEIQDILEKLKFNKAILKCDIEGAEYSILEKILKFNEKVDCILIEFHNIKSNIYLFKENINNLLRFYFITHLHGNNHDPLIENINVPNTLEITLVKKKFIHNKIFVNKFPIEGLDHPNNPGLKDLYFEFKN